MEGAVGFGPGTHWRIHVAPRACHSYVTSMYPLHTGRPTVGAIARGCLLCLLCVIATPAARAGVVINEILYHAPDDLEDLQFVELHNSSDQAADIGGWSFSKGLRFRFADGTRIGPHGFVVLCRNTERFNTFYKTPIAGVFDTPIPSKGSLIELVDARGSTVDAVKFKDRAPWPSGPDGYSGSLERISPEGASNDPANWTSSPLSNDREKPGGTPGQVNAGFSAHIPPAITDLKFAPDHPAPNQAITVTATIREGEAVQTVELLYRIAGPGFEKPEVTLPMSRQSNGQFTASVPGQAADQLVRFRVRAISNDGARRFFPAETEPRPALSAFVQGPIAPGTIPFGWILRTTETEMKSAQSQDGPRGFPFGPPRGGPGGPVDPDIEFIERTMPILRRNLDLSPAWFAATASPTDDNPVLLEKARQAFLARLDERSALIDSVLTRRGPAGDIDDLSKVLENFWATVVEAAKPALTKDQDASLRNWIGSRTHPPVPGRDTILRRVDLEGAWYAVTLNTPADPARLASLRKTIHDLDLERGKLLEEIASGQGRDTNFRDQRERADALGETIEPALKPLLSAEQAEQLTAWRQLPREAFVGLAGPRGGPGGPGGPMLFRGPPGFGGPPSVGGQGGALRNSHRSAFVYFDPASQTTELYDFVEIPSRKGGQKIHFLKDQLLRGMSGINLIYESDMATLVEPLAYEVYRRSGMAAEQSFHLRLWEDGRPAGYYLLVEQPNRAFLRRAKAEDGGNLYKLLWFGDGLTGQHAKRSNRHSDHADLQALVSALEKSQGDAQWEVIRRNFDVEQVATYFAVNMVLSHWDGFFNNYYAYHDSRGSGKWTMYPWDQDQTWGVTSMGFNTDVFFTMPLTFGMTGDSGPNDFGGGWWRPPGWFSGPLLANPRFRKVFLSKTKDILTSVYTPKAFGPVIDAMQSRLLPEARIRAGVVNQSPDDAERELKERFDRCRQHLQKRREFLLAQAELKSAPPWSPALLDLASESPTPPSSTPKR